MGNLNCRRPLSFDELAKILNIYEIRANQATLDKIKNEPSSKERRNDYKIIIPKTTYRLI